MGRARQMSEYQRNFLMQTLEESREVKDALADAEAEIARLTAQLTLIEQARLSEVIPGGAFQMAESWMTRALRAEAEAAQLRREAERTLTMSKLTAIMQKAVDETSANITIAPYRKKSAKVEAQ